MLYSITNPVFYYAILEWTTVVFLRFLQNWDAPSSLGSRTLSSFFFFLIRATMHKNFPRKENYWSLRQQDLWPSTPSAPLYSWYYIFWMCSNFSCIMWSNTWSFALRRWTIWILFVLCMPPAPPPFPNTCQRCPKNPIHTVIQMEITNLQRTWILDVSSLYNALVSDLMN